MIENLIEKYYSGETTSSEETILRTYFQQKEIPEDLKQYQSLFVALSELHDHKDLLLTEKQTPSLHNRKNILWKTAAVFTGIAASLLLIFTLLNTAQPQNYVMIDGKKNTQKSELEKAIQQSFDNVKIDEDDFFSVLND